MGVKVGSGSAPHLTIYRVTVHNRSVRPPWLESNLSHSKCRRHLCHDIHIHRRKQIRHSCGSKRSIRCSIDASQKRTHIECCMVCRARPACCADYLQRRRVRELCTRQDADAKWDHLLPWKHEVLAHHPVWSVDLLLSGEFDFVSNQSVLWCQLGDGG